MGLLGYWREPAGAVIHVDACGAGVCATLVKLVPNPEARVDKLNPDTNLRARHLCGLRIGNGFHTSDADHADGGKLYDPKSGKTYSGSLTAQGDTLHLRGYLGIKLFGRSETWTRTTATPTCGE